MNAKTDSHVGYTRLASLAIIAGGAYWLYKVIDDGDLALLTIAFFVFGMLYFWISWQHGPLGESAVARDARVFNALHVAYLLLVLLPLTLCCTAALLAERAPKVIDKTVTEIASDKLKGEWQVTRVVADRASRRVETNVVGRLSANLTGVVIPLGSATDYLVQRLVDKATRLLTMFLFPAFAVGGALLLLERLFAARPSQP